MHTLMFSKEPERIIEDSELKGAHKGQVQFLSEWRIELTYGDWTHNPDVTSTML